MRLLLSLLLLGSCGTKIEVPAKYKAPIELDIVNKDFKPLLGNENLFAGLLCASGEKDFCKAIYDNITPNGDFCRNEFKVTPMGCTDLEGSFSTDEALGVLLFIVSNKDQALAIRFWDYIKRNNYKFCTKANDDKCYIYPHLYGLMCKTWKYVKLVPSKEMIVGSALEGSILRVSASKVEVSYRTHLLMVHFYLTRLTNNWSKEIQTSANILLNRQPNNMFMQYLATGTFDRGLFFERYSQRTAKMSQWHQQRSDSEQAWKQSVGYDFLFLKNLYNKD